MNPDFNKTTVDTIAKRASYKCSNPDCRINTIGPSSNPNKSTKIGEAAHIYGARAGSKRYKEAMSDTIRSQITNAIWLCRNCHKLIDTDESRYSSNLLFGWRQEHDEFVLSTLGNRTDSIIFQEQQSILSQLKGYPPIIKRIIIDKPEGWEFSLTAQLMRHLNIPKFRQLSDLKNGLYLKSVEAVPNGQSFNWIQDRLTDLGKVVPPVVGLLNRLTKSWGKPGEPGNLNEILHVTNLFKDYLDHIIEFEEKLKFVNLPSEYEKALSLLSNQIGSQIEKLSSIPDDLDDILIQLESTPDEDAPTEIRSEFIFELSPKFEKDFTKELKRLSSLENTDYDQFSNSGCMTVIVLLITFSVLTAMII